MNKKHFTDEEELDKWLRQNRHLNVNIGYGVNDGRETWTVTWEG